MDMAQEYQKKNDTLHKLIAIDKDDTFGVTHFNSVKVATYKDKVCIPAELQAGLIKWYHDILHHD